MRILWLSPWMRPLARVQVEALRAQGNDVILVTTDQHPESDDTRDYEIVLDNRFKQASSWRPFLKAYRAARTFDPDIVVTELVRDPRWLAFGALGTRVNLVHDDRPHDSSEVRPRWERALFDRWTRNSCATVAFSEFVADAVRDGRVPGTSTPVHVVPLTSDLADDRVPPIAGPNDRRDFVLLGRINWYKNIDVVFDAWQRHIDGTNWRGDDLVIIGKGTIQQELPPHTKHRNEAFRYNDELKAISRSKASLVHYRQASQSGVQVLSMQLGVPTIVSDQGALPEFQTPSDPALGPDDVKALVEQFDRLAEPAIACERGLAARNSYDERFHSAVAGAQLHLLLSQLCDRASIDTLAPNFIEPVVPDIDVKL